MKKKSYKVYFIGDGYLCDTVIEPNGNTFAEKLNSVLEKLRDYVETETYCEQYDIDHIEEVEA